MMPSRRTVVSSVLGIAVGGCSGVPDQTQTRTATDRTTPTAKTLVETSPRQIPATAGVALLPAAYASVKTATDKSRPEVPHESPWSVLSDFSCFEFEEQSYTIASEVRGDTGYIDTFDVRERSAPGNESVVAVDSLDSTARERVVDAISSGEYVYDSREHSYRPPVGVVEYNGSYYAFDLSSHADLPQATVQILKRDDRSACVTITELDLGDSHRSVLSEAHRAREPTVAGETVNALRDSEIRFVIVGNVCYKVPVETT